MNSINRAELVWPSTELDWSIPPIAVPTNLSYFITLEINYYLDSNLSRPFTLSVAKALQTQKEDELESPDPVGTLP